MPLITVYFPGEPYRKAIIYKHDLKYFMDLGANKYQPETREKIGLEPDPEPMVEPQPLEPPPDVSLGDRGFGVPGSLQFHTHEIESMTDYRDIRDYVFTVSNSKMRKKRDGTVEGYRRTALMLIKRWLNNGGQSG